jgi:hypothetical protein
MFSFFGLPLKYIIAGVVIIGVITWGWIAFDNFKEDQQRIGWDGAIAAVSKQNAIAAKAAVKVQLSVDQCFDRGGDWDVTTGTCVEPEPEDTQAENTQDGDRDVQ